MPGLVPGIHVREARAAVNGRDRPGHEGWNDLTGYVEGMVLALPAERQAASVLSAGASGAGFGPPFATPTRAGRSTRPPIV
ncbi:MAG: hypothetical protein K0R27_3650 [Xanthobacteraceae bacterium]|nr:hypothetical protein [Xanthobacteraceae bacterium]